MLTAAEMVDILDDGKYDVYDPVYWGDQSDLNWALLKDQVYVLTRFYPLGLHIISKIEVLSPFK